MAELDDEYIAKMEDVLETYEKPYDPAEPVVCLDEKPVTLHADVRPASDAKPGREARSDNEYERRGTANVFCAVEPKAGHHFTFRDTQPFRLRVRASGLRTRPAVPGGQNHPSGNGQSQYPPSEVSNGHLRNRDGNRDLGVALRFTTPRNTAVGSTKRRSKLAYSRGSASEIGEFRTCKRLRRESRAWNRRMNHDQIKINWQFDRRAARRKFGYKCKPFKRLQN